MGAFEGKRVTVMGLGRFGGGVGAAVWLAEQGADVVATDMQTVENLGEALGPLRRFVDSGAVSLRLGGHNVSDFTETDVVVVNPGVPSPWDNRMVRAAQAAGIACTTEIQLVAERLPNRERVIGVTGTAGKSTTTAMIEAGLRAGLAAVDAVGCGADSATQVVVGGNFGGSLLSRLGSIGADDWVVLELSSAMLWWLGGQDGVGPGWSPGVAVVTNFAPNHVDWHGSAANYRACKQELLRSQHPGDVAVLGADVADWECAGGVERVVVEPGDFGGALCTPGAHNRMNAAVAQAACRAALGGCAGEQADEAIGQGIGGFAGLPHRCCLVHTVGVGTEAIRFYNDSKCTVPSGVGLAVRGVGEVVGGAERVHVIAGGSDKGVDVSEIGALAERLAGLYVIGATAEKIAMGAGGRAQLCGDLPNAVAMLRERVRPGEAVLLSPGCASFGEFVNFEERGHSFERLVKEGWHGDG